MLNTGIVQGTPISDQKRIRLLNSFWLTWAFFLIPFAIEDYLSSENVAGSMLIHFTSSVALIFVAWCQYKAKYQIARVLFIFFLIFILSVSTNILEPGQNVELFYFLVPVISILLIQNRWVSLSLTFIAFLLFYVPNMFFKHYGPNGFNNPVYIIFVFAAVYAAFSYSQTLNQKNEEKINSAYLKLKKTKNSELADLKLKALKSQMNPHFMFNAINSIQTFVLKGEKKKAYEYMSKFSEMIRENLLMSDKNFVSIFDELSVLNKYLDIEKLRFKDDFEYKIYGDDELDKIFIPTMIIQPFVENAIKHGLFHKEEGAKKLTISFKQTEKILHCIVNDNGVGFKKVEKIHRLNDKTDQSFSLEAITQKLNYLKDHYQTDVGYSFNPVLEGTEVEIKIPYYC